MSMEGGWDLDFPGEPDAASNDEMPRPAEPEIVYWYLVESDTGKRWKNCMRATS